LNWVPDELFVRGDIYESVIKPFGILSNPVIQHSSGQAFENIGLTIDTGAPSTTLWQNNQLFVNPQFLNQPKGTAIPYAGNLKSKVRFSMRAPTIVGDGEGLDFNLVTGQKSTINQISASVRKNDGGPTWSGYMNTGLMLFTHYDVMFDVENGLVGFRAIK
jgi:hypothetical protein